MKRSLCGLLKNLISRPLALLRCSRRRSRPLCGAKATGAAQWTREPAAMRTKKYLSLPAHESVWYLGPSAVWKQGFSLGVLRRFKACGSRPLFNNEICAHFLMEPARYPDQRLPFHRRGCSTQIKNRLAIGQTGLNHLD